MKFALARPRDRSGRVREARVPGTLPSAKLVTLAMSVHDRLSTANSFHSMFRVVHANSSLAIRRALVCRNIDSLNANSSIECTTAVALRLYTCVKCAASPGGTGEFDSEFSL